MPKSKTTDKSTAKPAKAAKAETETKSTAKRGRPSIYGNAPMEFQTPPLPDGTNKQMVGRYRAGYTAAVDGEANDSSSHRSDVIRQQMWTLGFKHGAVAAKKGTLPKDLIKVAVKKAA